MLASGLAPQAGSSLLAGEEQHGVRLHKSPPVNQASKRQGGGTHEALPDTTAQAGAWTAGYLPDEARPSLERLLQLVAQDPSFLEGPSLYSGHLAGPQNLSSVNSNCLAFCRAPKLLE